MGQCLFRAEADGKVAALGAARRPADEYASAFAELAIEKFLPLHVAAIFYGEAGKVGL